MYFVWRSSLARVLKFFKYVNTSVFITLFFHYLSSRQTELDARMDTVRFCPCLNNIWFFAPYFFLKRICKLKAQAWLISVTPCVCQNFCRKKNPGS